jgi:hexosaminidase
MQREGLKDEDQLQSWFIARIATFLAKRHRKLIGWDEVLNGGLVEGATVQSWRDSSFTRAALLSGHDVIASPVNFAYLDRSPGSLTVDQVLRFNPVPPGVDSVAARHVLGGEGNLWTEWITSTATLDLMAYPRLLALSEALWTAGARDAAAFRARLGADGVARLRALGVAVGPLDADLVRILVPYDTAAKAPRLRARVGSPEIVVRATSDGSAPTADSPVIADSALLTGAGVWRLRAFVGRDPILSEKRIVLLSHKARGLPVQFAARPDRRYPGTGPNTLTDGIAASADHADGLWQGWWGPDLVATIDFGSVTSIDTVQAGFLQNQRAWILLPASVDVQLSDDGETWRSLGVQGHDVPAERDAALVRAFVFTAPAGTRARYVRVVAINAGPLPSWHPGAGRKPWIFADEIIVR